MLIKVVPGALSPSTDTLTEQLRITCLCACVYKYMQFASKDETTFVGADTVI